jgi:hypothetical protein
MGWLDDAKLGLKGAADLVIDVGSAGFYKSHFAADEYAAQVARDPSLSESTAITAAAADGASPEQLREQAKQAAGVATDQGAIKTAASKTVEKIGEKVGEIADTTASNLPWILGGVAALGVAIYAWRAAR